MHASARHLTRIPCMLAVSLIASLSPASAAESVIVAFGASNTYGKGVGRSEAYPAQLEQLLCAKGYDVKVINSGVNAQRTGQMLKRLNASVPAGTAVLIFQPGTNDRRKGQAADRAGNIAKILKRLSARGVSVVQLKMSDFASLPKQTDGQHLTPAGYRALAQSLVPRVVAVLPH